MSAFIYNVTFDARDPRALSRFWAAVTGYNVAEASDDAVALRAPDERGIRRILFMRVDDPTPGKNRVHVDLAAREPDAEIERVLGLGAELVDARIDGAPTWRGRDGIRWVVLRDPEGNEFCIG
jgi:predicted enzyme related to lactoylglutathione lyase